MATCDGDKIPARPSARVKADGGAEGVDESGEGRLFGLLALLVLPAL
jgi:hypothetical protein